jgi:hypothetical protein
MVAYHAFEDYFSVLLESLGKWIVQSS